MAVNSKVQPTKHSHKARIWIISGIVIFLALGVTAYTIVTTVIGPILGVPLASDYGDTQSGMTSYLKDKYGKEFVVGVPLLEDSGIGVKGRWVAKAYSKEDNALTFDVDFGQGSEQYNDQYAAAIWSISENANIKTALTKDVKQLESVDAKLIMLLSTNRLISGAIPSLDQISTLNNKGITYQLTIRETGYDKQFDNDYVNNLKRFCAYLMTKRAVGNKHIGYAISIGDGYQYGVSLDDEKIDKLLGDTNAQFNNYFKHVKEQK